MVENYTKVCIPGVVDEWGYLPPTTRPEKMRGDTITILGLKKYYFYRYKMIIKEYYEEVYATTFNNKFFERHKLPTFLKVISFLLLHNKLPQI